MMCNKHNHQKTNHKTWRFIFGLPLILAFITLAGYVFMLLWNSVVVDIFNIKMITYWQSIGLLLISKLIFGGFHHNHCGFGHRMMHRRYCFKPEIDDLSNPKESEEKNKE
jgi:hypothetical protein